MSIKAKSSKAVTLYKITTQDNYTRKGEYNPCLWGENVTHKGTGKGRLCTSAYVHAYEHPLLAALFNPIHATVPNPKLWRAKGKIAKRDNQIKAGCVALTTLRTISYPQLTTEFRIRFAIKCALKVYQAPKFVKWAQDWLSGKDRSATAAAYAARAAAYAADAATYAARAAAYAADAAARAADAAAYAAYAADAATNAADAAAYAAAYAADAAAYAADAAAYAARAADAARKTKKPFLLNITLEVAAELKVKWEE